MANKLQFTLRFDEKVEDYLRKNHPEVTDHRIIQKSLDARGSNRGKTPTYHYTVEVISGTESFDIFQRSLNTVGTDKKIVVIGAGPAGLFCALRLLDSGVKGVLLERGASAKTRMRDIAKFWRYGEFNPESNVCFGAGGAGLYSDGKLITRVKSPLIKDVMQRFVEFGAPKETAYVSNPHLGSNKIRTIIEKVSEHLVSGGWEIHYDTKVEDIEFSKEQVSSVKTNSSDFPCDHLVLATGHSAKDIYLKLHSKKVEMKAKNFAIGVRIEHSRRYLDELQYGKFTQCDLGAARYSLTYNNKSTKRGCYTFCMCPGGYVLSSGTNTDGIVTNGMSNFARNSPWSNSAIVVSTKVGTDFPDEVLAGMKWQEEIETKAFEASKKLGSGRELPCMTVKEFFAKKILSKEIPYNSCPSGLVKVNLHDILPKAICNEILNALEAYNKKLSGFSSDEVLLIGPETRTSAPMTILRDKQTLKSLSHSNLYPVGEGAGYAGGITSAAVDGMKAAESILESL